MRSRGKACACDMDMYVYSLYMHVALFPFGQNAPAGPVAMSCPSGCVRVCLLTVTVRLFNTTMQRVCCVRRHVPPNPTTSDVVFIRISLSCESRACSSFCAHTFCMRNMLMRWMFRHQCARRSECKRFCNNTAEARKNKRYTLAINTKCKRQKMRVSNKHNGHHNNSCIWLVAPYTSSYYIAHCTIACV